MPLYMAHSGVVHSLKLHGFTCNGLFKSLGLLAKMVTMPCVHARSCGSYCFETLILLSANTLTRYNIEHSTWSNSEGSLPIFHNHSDTFKEIHRCDKGKYINLLFSYRSMLTVRSVRLLKGVSRVLLKRFRSVLP